MVFSITYTKIWGKWSGMNTANWDEYLLEERVKQPPQNTENPSMCFNNRGSQGQLPFGPQRRHTCVGENNKQIHLNKRGWKSNHFIPLLSSPIQMMPWPPLPMAKRNQN